MESFSTIALAISLGINILGALFAVYIYFRTPDEKADKSIALIAEQIKNDREAIQKQVEWSQQGTDRRFKDVQDNLDKVVTLTQNHIHTLDTKITSVGDTQTTMAKEIVKLATILDERLPKKNTDSSL